MMKYNRRNMGFRVRKWFRQLTAKEIEEACGATVAMVLLFIVLFVICPLILH